VVLIPFIEIGATPSGGGDTPNIPPVVVGGPVPSGSGSWEPFPSVAPAPEVRNRMCLALFHMDNGILGPYNRILGKDRGFAPEVRARGLWPSPWPYHELRVAERNNMCLVLLHTKMRVFGPCCSENGLGF
jgi:hypothetical protein